MEQANKLPVPTGNKQMGDADVTPMERSLYTLRCSLEQQVSESTVSPRKGKFTVSQVWNDSFHLQGLKLEVTQVVRLGNHNDIFAERLQAINR